MGTGYKKNTAYNHSISDNMPKTTSEFSFYNGYFGIKWDCRKGYSRHIVSNNPIQVAEKSY